jgi:capsular exopolysaccharide synthesis family protein
VAAAAQAPVLPNYSRRLKMMALVLMGSCAAGMGVGIWRELTDQTVRSAQDVQYVTDLPLIATVPDSQLDRLPTSAENPVLSADHPDTVSSDEYRRILTRIIYPPEGTAELNTVLVTSATRGDGKTSVACNLAISLARANRRVLLLDVCARRPTVERTLGLEQGPGLAEILASELQADEAIRPTRFENLSVLGPGLLGKEVIGKLASRDTVTFLEQAEQSFEHVIIDTPPALLMADARLLAPIVDGVIVVIGADITTLGMAQRCLSSLQQIGANIIGVVLNRLRHTPGGYLRGNLEKYYTYDRPAGIVRNRRRPVDEEDATLILMAEEVEHMVQGTGIRPKRHT